MTCRDDRGEAMNGIRLLAACALGIAAIGIAPIGISGAAEPARTMRKSEIPAGFAIGGGQPPLALRVDVDDAGVRSVHAAEASEANITANGDSQDGRTMLTIEHTLNVVLKFDLYVSRDGERFAYTSSCAVTPGIASFEMWEQPIRAFAIGNPRVVDGDDIPCD